MANQWIEARYMTATNFQQNGLGGMLSDYYHDSPFNALFDAGKVKKGDEAYMRSPGHAHESAA